MKYALSVPRLSPKNRVINKLLRAYITVNALLYLDSESLQKVNVDGCLSAYISQMSDYLLIDDPDVDKLIASFEEIGVVFDTIDEEHADAALLTAVFRKNLYELNAHNIVVMLHTQYGIRDDEVIRHRNYSAIMSQPDSPMAVYILTRECSHKPNNVVE